jgi:hypothetical protein
MIFVKDHKDIYDAANKNHRSTDPVAAILASVSKGMEFSGTHLIQHLTNSVAPEPEGSSPHSQQPANCPYPEPGESIPPPSQSP